jgi:hypothetical protein
MVAEAADRITASGAPLQQKVTGGLRIAPKNLKHHGDRKVQLMAQVQQSLHPCAAG